MTINISRRATVADFQAAFTQNFPFLKAVFFRNNSDSDNWWSDMVINNQITLWELSDAIPAVTENITISPNISVAEFEHIMKSRFDLNIKIFRFNYGDWKEISQLKHMNLAGMNERGALHATTV